MPFLIRHFNTPDSIVVLLVGAHYQTKPCPTTGISFPLILSQNSPVGEDLHPIVLLHKVELQIDLSRIDVVFECRIIGEWLVVVEALIQGPRDGVVDPLDQHLLLRLFIGLEDGDQLKYLLNLPAIAIPVEVIEQHDFINHLYTCMLARWKL